MQGFTAIRKIGHGRLKRRSLEPLFRLSQRWRVVADECADPLIPLRAKRGFVYEIGADLLGIWLNRARGRWIRKFRERFGFVDVRQQGDHEAVLGWPANHPRTDEMLALLGARSRRYGVKATNGQLAALAKARAARGYGKYPAPGPKIERQFNLLDQAELGSACTQMKPKNIADLESDDGDDRGTDQNGNLPAGPDLGGNDGGLSHG